VPYVVDYDDAIFHSYDSSPSRWIRKALSNKLDGLLAVSYAVTVGNNYLAQYAHSHGARRVVLIPTVVDIDRYRVTPEPPGDVFRIAWIGSPGTTKYLQLLAEPLRRLALEKKIMLVTIGAGPLHLPGVPLEQHAWSLDNETQLLETIHVGVMPLPDSPWERGKCGYKLIQYMACGRPVVASPVGINQEIVTPEIGFLASDVQGWYEGLRALSDQPALRQRMGQAARDRVEQSYSLQVTAPKIVRLLADAADGAKPCVA
jgi:glycosyltransferase involved in cell wall biosynthesis